jgi:hypothetical protein
MSRITRARRPRHRTSTGHRPIDSYLLPNNRSSSALTSISIVDSDSDDDVTLLQSSQQATDSTLALFPESPVLSPRKMTAAMRKRRDDHAAAAVAASSAVELRRTTSLPVSLDDWDSHDDQLPFSGLLFHWTQSASESTAIDRRALSDISNVTPPIALSISSRQALEARMLPPKYQRMKLAYQRMRARFAHPDDSTMCRYCGIREHSALHHEDVFKRSGSVSHSYPHVAHSSTHRFASPTHLNPCSGYCGTVQIRAPSQMTPAQLDAEVERCTRKDGSIGLASVCTPCHREAGHKSPSKSPVGKQRAIRRNRQLDNAAKVARGECECDEECGRRVRAEDVGLFEWDHLVQSFDDPGYRTVSYLVTTGKSAVRCEEERAKCRLLYFKCHRLHTGEQQRRHHAR